MHDMNHPADTLAALYPDLGARGPIEPAAASGFSGAAVWRIESVGGPMALRCWPEAGSDRARLRGLHRLLAHAFGRGATRLAVPVPNRHGETVSEHGGRLWQLEPWMPGAADFRSNPSPIRLTHAMHCLTDFHRAASDFACRPAEATWFTASGADVCPTVANRLNFLTECRAGEREQLRAVLGGAPHEPFDELARETVSLFDRLVDSVGVELAEAAHKLVPLRPCLRDVWHDHVLFTGDEVTGLIDPSACRCDCVATDIARLLDSLLGDDPPRWRSAIDTYRGRFPITPAEESLIPTLDRSGVLLSGMNWLRKRYLTGGITADDPRVIDRLERIVRRLRAMVRTG
jgi:Ser/Thr protein kinase RdoA (MazF antagonist)